MKSATKIIPLESPATITTDEWMKALQEACTDLDDVPPGWATINQLSELWGLEATQTRKKLTILYQKGRIEKKKFRVSNLGRAAYPTVHYKLKS